MDDLLLTTIRDFVDDVTSVVETQERVTPLKLYHRLIHSEENVKKHENNILLGFENFFESNLENIINCEWDDFMTSTIYIDGNVKVYVDLSEVPDEPENNRIVRDYLLKISEMLNPGSVPEQSMMSSSQFGIDTTTEEGKFIDDVFSMTSKSLEERTGNDEEPDMVSAFTGMAMDGTLGTIFEKMKVSASEGKISQKSMIQSIQGLLGNMLPKDEDDQPSDQSPENQRLDNDITDEVSTECDTPIEPKPGSIPRRKRPSQKKQSRRRRH